MGILGEGERKERKRLKRNDEEKISQRDLPNGRIDSGEEDSQTDDTKHHCGHDDDDETIDDKERKCQRKSLHRDTKHPWTSKNLLLKKKSFSRLLT